MSDPRGSIRKELTQCQHCYKSRGPGVTLRKCSSCQVDIYCSRECQRAAWKTHKAKCLLNQRNDTMPAEVGDTLKLLRGFTSKHRPTIAEAGIRALNVMADPSRAERDILIVYLMFRPDSTRTHTSFIVTGVNVVSIDTFPAGQAAEMRGQLKQASDDNKRTGMAGAIFVLLMDMATGTSNVAPVGFPKGAPFPPLETTWQEWLTTRLNEGIVV